MLESPKVRMAIVVGSIVLILLAVGVAVFRPHDDGGPKSSLQAPQRLM